MVHQKITALDCFLQGGMNTVYKHSPLKFFCCRGSAWFHSSVLRKVGGHVLLFKDSPGTEEAPYWWLVFLSSALWKVQQAMLSASQEKAAWAVLTLATPTTSLSISRQYQREVQAL